MCSFFFERLSRTGEPMDFFRTPGIKWLNGRSKRNDKHYSVTSALQLSSVKQIFTQKFESPGLQIEYQTNWKVNASSRGIQSKIHWKSKC